MIRSLKMVNVQAQLPPCYCGCEHTSHIHASLGNRVAPSGVVHHLCPSGHTRFFKMDRLSTTQPHTEGHDMTDVELLYSFACYDESPESPEPPESSESPESPESPEQRLPLPRTVRWESFLHADSVKAADAALTHTVEQEFSVQRSIFCPVATTNLPEHGSVCRFGDRVVLAKRADAGALRLYTCEVVGTAPAIGIMVVASKIDLPELSIAVDEPIFATEAHVVLLERGIHWGAPELADQAKAEFESLEGALVRQQFASATLSQKEKEHA